jgi:hypothetical protein
MAYGAPGYRTTNPDAVSARTDRNLTLDHGTAPVVGGKAGMSALPPVARDEAEHGRYFDASRPFVRELLAARDRRILVDGPLGTENVPGSSPSGLVIGRAEGRLCPHRLTGIET